MTLKPDEVLRLCLGAEDLLEKGDSAAGRIAIWMAFTIADTSDELDPEVRLRLARVAAKAALQASPSLRALAIRVVDPVLMDATTGDLDIDVGELEELNFMRRRLNETIAPHPVPRRVHTRRLDARGHMIDQS